MTHRECSLWCWLAMLLVALTVLPSGCSQDCSRPDGYELPPRYLPATSTAHLLENFLLAYQRRDAEGIDSLLSADFLFHFCEEDQSRPEIPESWNRGSEIEAHQGIFDEEYVQTIALAFAYGTPYVDTLLTTAQDTVWAVEVTNFDFELFGTPRSHPGEAPQLYKVDSGQAEFCFHPTGAYDPSSGEPIWKIVAIRETTSNAPLAGKRPHPAESCTWGAVKSVFR
ncbi:MAG: hypothetical protein GF330_06390 [Candidatus Eisenbacteria bacterium]|nr:hypothetical protein [Candidatus Eisenbacteria bacterium]